MYKNIVIPVDLSDKNSFKVVFPPALNFVSAFGAQIHLLNVIPDFGMKMVEDFMPKSWVKDQKAKYTKQMMAMVNNYIPSEVEVTCHVDRGAIYDKVIGYADKVGADLIILSAVRPQQKDYMLGPNASKIVRHSAVSVLVVRE